MNRAEKRRQQKMANKAAQKRPPSSPTPFHHDQQTFSMQQAIDLAMQHLRAGSLPEAESIYQQIIQADPNNLVSLNNLGSIAAQMSKYDIAVEMIVKAIAIDPNNAAAHYNLGIVFKKQGKLEDAVASYHKALAIKPDYVEAHNNLGNTFQKQGRLDDAVASYRKALTIKLDYAEAHNNLGNTFQKQGRLDDAVASYRKALAIKPSFSEVHKNLGNTLQKQGKLDDAVSSYHKALAIKPDYAEAQVCSAICAWVQTNQNECASNLSHINPKTILGTNSWVVSYYTFLLKLTEYYADHPREYRRLRNVPSLYAIGESHCLTPAHTSVRLNETQYHVEPRLIFGCRAWDLGNTLNNEFKVQFEKVASSLVSGETAILMFGEIDCRPGEKGILADHKETGGDLSKVITKIVQSYVEYVSSIFAPRDIIPIFYGVPARIIRKDGRAADDETIIAYIIGEFNRVLGKETKNRNIRFLDVFSLTNDADGHSSGKFHIDSIHVFPSVLGDLLKQL